MGGVRYTSSDSVSDPNGLVTAYAALFERLGGKVLIGDAGTLEQSWRVMTEQGQIEADWAIVALGPWSGDVAKKFGYNLPLAVKRGYHCITRHKTAHGSINRCSMSKQATSSRRWCAASV